MLIDLKRLKQRMEVQAELERSGHSGWESGNGLTSSGPKPSAVTTITEIPFSRSDSVAIRPTSSAEYLISEIKSHKRGLALAMSALLIAGVAVAYFAFSGNGIKPIDSVAVLPFQSSNGDQNSDAMSDSVTEKIINSMSRLPGVRVMSYSSVLRYKGQQPDPRAVGRDLGVRGVLTGRVVQRGDSLTIYIELVDASDNSRIWGQQYNRKFSDALLVQEEISKDIADKLRLKLSGADRKKLDAAQLYLKGRYYWSKRTADGLTQGADFFQQAIDNDPNFALAYVGLADCYNMLVVYSKLSPKEGFPKARDAAVKALELDDSLSEAHTSLAFVKARYEWKWSEADREFNRAIDLNPSYAPAHMWYSNFLASQGRFDQAINESKRTQELDPLSLISKSHLAFIYFFDHKYDLAIERSKKAIELDATFFVARRYAGLAYQQKGQYDEAIAEFQKAVNSSSSSLIKAELANIYGSAGKRAEAEQILAELTEQSKKGQVSSYLFALIYTGLGEKDQALDALEKAYEERAEFLVYLNVDPRMQGLRSDPRFGDLISRIGLTP